MAEERKPGDGTAMDARRFTALATAYGGELRRWPEAERNTAALFARSDEGRAILIRAGKLDAILDGYRVKGPGRALQDSIVATAPAQLGQSRRQRLWWLGMGLAGVGLAGAIAGLALVTIVTPQAQSDHYAMDANATAFGDAGSDADAIEEDL